MRGLWLDSRQLEFRQDLPMPTPAASEALVKVLRAGICNTDLELVRGYYPFSGILGHEFVGEVVSGTPELVGKRVVGEINAACGTCRWCRRNMPTHCEVRTVLGIVNRHGAFAEYLTLPIANLHVLPETIATDAATFVEPLAAALEIQEQVKVTANDRVLVVGAGKLGQLIAQSLALTGCDLMAIGRDPDKLYHLQIRDIKTGTIADVVRGSYDIAVDCTGNPDGFEIAMNSLRPRGTLVLKSTYAGKLTFDVSALVVNEITLVGSRCGDFKPAIELLANRTIDVNYLIAASYNLNESLAAFDRASKRGTLKVLIEM